MSAFTPRLWCGWVVRIQRSLEMCRRFHIASKRAAMRSTCSCGAMPLAAAAWATFCPCSSIPMQKRTWRPCSRWYRALASAPIFS